jgi:hypothetical protein
MMKRNILLWLGFAGTAWCQQITVPVNIQYQLLAKSLPYVKFLATKPEGVCKIALIYQSKNRMSVEAKTEFENMFSSTPCRLGVRPIEIKPFDLSESIKLEDALRDAMIAYITPLRAVDIGKIVTLCKMMNVLSVDAVAEEIRQGVILGFDVEGGKPKILVNLRSAEMSGIAFSADYLKLVKIVE